jgi:hypothetical protein
LHGEKDKQFDESSPSMSSVLVGIDQDSEFVQDAATEIELAFFSNEHYIMYKEPEEEEDDPEPYKLAKAFLKDYEKFPFAEDSCHEHLPELTIQSMDRVLKACRALMSLHSPIPGELGGSYKDMLDLWGNTDDYELCQNEDIFAAIVLKNKVMKMRILGYWSLAKEDDSIGPEYHELVRTIQRMIAGNPDGSEIDFALITDEAITKLDAWKPPVVREHGLALIVSGLSDWVKKKWADDESDIGVAECMMNVIKALTSSGELVDPALQKIGDALSSKSKASAQASARASFLKALESWDNGVGD